MDKNKKFFVLMPKSYNVKARNGELVKIENVMLDDYVVGVDNLIHFFDVTQADDQFAMQTTIIKGIKFRLYDPADGRMIEKKISFKDGCALLNRIIEAHPNEEVYFIVRNDVAPQMQKIGYKVVCGGKLVENAEGSFQIGLSIPMGVEDAG